MGAKKQTIGYRYYFSLHMGLGRGPLNQLVEIRVGDITATDGPITIPNGGVLFRIDKPNLFGGDKKEGGVQGPCYIYSGHRDQVLQPTLSSGSGIPKKNGGSLPSIAQSLGGDVPNFRGVTTLWFDGLVCAMNPYPKEWSFRVRRTTAGWYNDDVWYPEKAKVTLRGGNGSEIHAMNGAHMLYEVNTNPEWGRGMPKELIDENSYIAAANTLCEEGFGLCIPWFRQENIKEFIPVIINHIGGVQYVSRETGLLTLRLIRGDYDIDDLPLFTPETGLLDIQDEDNSGEETAYNEIIVTGFDPTTKEEIQVRVHNLASIQAQGEIISNTIEYRGLATRDLVARVAQRELKVQLPLRRMNVVLDRRGWRIAPGMPFRISHPAKGIQNLVLRAGECNDGTLTEGRITIKAVEDIFGMPQTAFVTPDNPVWTPPSFTAIPSPETNFIETNWRNYYRRSEPADRAAVDAGTSYVGMMAKKPANTQTDGYDLITRTDSTDYDVAVSVNGGFCAWLTLAAHIDPLATTLNVEEENRGQFDAEFTEGMVVLIDEEEMAFLSFDTDTGVAEIARGVSDTIPAAHDAGATIWLVDDEIVSDGNEYQDGETVYGKALVRTASDLLEQEMAEEDSVVVNQRVFRPYPPGNVKINGESIYTATGEQVDPVFTWAHRDRITEADAAVGHTEGSVGPEPGTTYNFRIYAQDGTTLLREIDVGNVDTWTYDATMQAADGGPTSVWFELESVRDGLASHFNYRFNIVLKGGWGYGWGLNWGGAA